MAGPLTMCSVRQSPMPCAPLLRAWSASSGVSALAITLMVLSSSTHDMSVPRSPERAGGARACLPTSTSPVLPFRDTQSPSDTVLPPRLKVCSGRQQGGARRALTSMLANQSLPRVPL